MEDPEGRTPDLHRLARLLLAEVVGALEAAGRPVPKRRYVADGPNNAIAVDEAQLVTGLGSLTNAEPNAAPLVARSAWEVQVYADLARLAPSIEDVDDRPSDDAITASAEALAIDATALVRASQSFARSCRQLSGVSITPLGPEGGYARWVLLATVPVI